MEELCFSKSIRLLQVYLTYVEHSVHARQCQSDGNQEYELLQYLRKLLLIIKLNLYAFN